MSGITSFLFQGQPVPPAPTGSDSTSNFPLWYQDYLYDTAGAAANLAGQPYQPPPFQQVAAPSSQTQQGWQMANNNVGNWQPAVGAAGALTMSAANPLSNSTIGSYASGAGAGINGLQSGLSGGYGGNMLGLGSATTGAMNDATQGQINNYLNPYLNNVASGIESQLNNNLMQNVMPGIQDRYTASGQSGSPQQMQAENNAIYQNQQALGQALSPVYQNAYSGALSAAQSATQAGFGAGQTGANALLGAGQYGYGLGTSTAQGQQGMQQAAGAQMGQLGALNQQLSSGDMANVSAAGQGQDSVNQANINAALTQYQNQQQWPYQQIGMLSNVLRGQALPTTQQQTTLGYNQASYTPSPVQAGVGTAATVGALTGGLRARGGAIRKPRPRGALSDFAMAA